MESQYDIDEFISAFVFPILSLDLSKLEKVFPCQKQDDYHNNLQRSVPAAILLH